MRKTPLNRIGKVGRANLLANKLIKAQNPPQYCEVRLEGCLGGMFLTIAHHEKRNWYRGDAELLSDKKHWVVACITCHEKMEFNKQLTEEVFKRLRNG